MIYRYPGGKSKKQVQNRILRRFPGIHELRVFEYREYREPFVGGGGIYPTDGLAADTCELVKMYLLPEARGMGLGRELIEKSLTFAKEYGYQKVYLESMPELKQALKVYEKFGFEY